MTVFGRSSRIIVARRNLCWREGWTSESGTPRMPRNVTGYGIVVGHVLCKKQAVFGGASCSCHWVCEAPWTSGGPTSGRRRRGRYHSLPRFYRGGAVGSRRDRKIGP